MGLSILSRHHMVLWCLGVWNCLNVYSLLSFASPCSIFIIYYQAFKYCLPETFPFCLSFSIDYTDTISHLFTRTVLLYNEFNSVALMLSSISCVWQRPFSVPEERGSEREKRTARAPVSRSCKKRVRGVGTNLCGTVTGV